MSVTAYRITLARYGATAFDGEGARLHGGRWNSPGQAMVYAASSISLATLELLVHLESPSLLRRRYAVIPITLPGKTISRLSPRDLPEDWTDPAGSHGARAMGDSWLRAGKSLALAVPSVVVPQELNYLINPRHPDFSLVQIGSPEPLLVDSRLGRT